MSPEVQLGITIAFSVVNGLFGWLLKALFDRMRDMEEADRSIAKEVGSLKDSLPERYVRRDDFKQALDNIFQAVRRIEDKLDEKADKP